MDIAWVVGQNLALTHQSLGLGDDVLDGKPKLLQQVLERG